MLKVNLNYSVGFGEVNVSDDLAVGNRVERKLACGTIERKTQSKEFENSRLVLYV